MRLTTDEQLEWGDVLPLRVRCAVPRSVTQFIDFEKADYGIDSHFWHYWTEVFCIASQVLKESKEVKGE